MRYLYPDSVIQVFCKAPIAGTVKTRLMTVLTAGLALVPLVVAGNIPGHEIEHPMAIVILGGLVTSTLLNLLVLPALYLRFGKGQLRPASYDTAGVPA